ncbi:hypothetical protein ABPG74_004530 [Tetrahymena malaccensis]
MKKGSQQEQQKQDADDEYKQERDFIEYTERHKSESFTQQWNLKQQKKQQSLHNSIDINFQDIIQPNNQIKCFAAKVGKIKLPELPQANDILPKSAQKKEVPNYVIGTQYVSVVNLDGQHPEEERLQSYLQKGNIKFGVQKQNQGNIQSEQNCKVQEIKSNTPLYNQQQPYLQQSFKELSSLLKEYQVVYQKYPQNMYSSFNIIQCDLKKIQENISLKKTQIEQDGLQEFRKEEHSFSQDNKTVSYFQNDNSALDNLQSNIQNLNESQQNVDLQFTKSYQYDSKKGRKNTESQSVDVREKKKSIDESQNNIFERKFIKQKENTFWVSSSNNGIKLGVPIEDQKSDILNKDSKNFNASINLLKQNQQLSNSSITKQQNNQLLSFESKFECGNLSYAFIKNERQYFLVLQNDINTKGNTQWFYFRVSNKKALGQVTLSILNYQKPYSLFNQGMKILVYSKKKREKQNLGWHRSCSNINYYKNEYKRQTQNIPISTYYTLEFTYDFTEEQDEIFFAYNYPYSYSDLQNYLESIENDPFKRQFVNRKVLCRTLADNRVDLLTITDGSSNYHVNKQQIVVSARVHPGETVSSFMVKGLIDYILEDTPESKYLRNNFIFKIIPMLNPDGVIHGNYRCSLSGRDLNRQWKKPSKGIYAEIHSLKKLILNTKRLVLFCDLHGHSIKKNIFVYGCHDYSQPSACRELPYIISKIYQPFSFKDCNFKVQTQKQGTARVVLWKSLRIPNIFTLESSFCGPSYDDVHFRLQDLQNVGKVLCQAFMIYFQPSQLKQGNNTSRRGSKDQIEEAADKNITSRRNTQYKEDFALLQKQQINQISNLMNQFNINKDQIQNDLLNEDLIQMGMNDSDGSDSCPSEDEIQNVLKCPVNIEEPKQENSKSPQPKKSIKKLAKKTNETTKTNLLNCLPPQRPVGFNSSTSKDADREYVKPVALIRRLEVPCKSRLILNDDLNIQANINSISPRNNLTSKFKQKTNPFPKNIQNKKDITIPNSILTHNISNNLKDQEKSPQRKVGEQQEGLQQEETVNLKSTLIFKRNPLYDYYESIQPKIKIKASELGNLKRNLENEINNIINNKRSLTPTKMIPTRLDQLLNYNLNGYNQNSGSSNSNNISNQRNLSSNLSHNNNNYNGSNRHFANQQKPNYFPSIKSNNAQKEATTPTVQIKINQNQQQALNLQFLNNGVQTNSNQQQRNFSQNLRLEDELIYSPQNLNNLTPINNNNRSLESSAIIQNNHFSSKSPNKLRKKYSFNQQNQIVQPLSCNNTNNNHNSYLNTEPSELVTLHAQNRLETETYIIDEINKQHKKLLIRNNNPTRSSSINKKISIGGDQNINSTEILNYQPAQIRQKRQLNRVSVISAVQNQNTSLSNQNKIRLNEDLFDYIKFGNQNQFK